MKNSTANELLGDREYMSDGVVVSNPLRALVNLEGSVSSAFRSLEGAGKEVSQLAQTVNQAVGGSDDQIKRIMQKTEVALIISIGRCKRSRKSWATNNWPPR